jgi:hypothetical protein
MANPEVERAQSQAEASRAAAKRAGQKQWVAIVAAFALGVILTAGAAIVVVAYNANQATPAATPSAPAPPPSSTPAAGTYWSNSSYTGQADQMGGGCVTTPSECTPFWFDFNVTCPTGNMVLNGTWSNIAGFPTMLQLSVNGTVIATSGGDVPWYGEVNASSGHFHLIAHGTVEFRMLSAWDMSQEANINGVRDSYSVIL